MSKYYFNTASNSFGVYTNFEPKSLSSDWIQLTETTYNAIQTKLQEGYTFEYKNGGFVYTKVEPSEEQIKEGLRSRRAPLLTAFDKYKTNVEYGITAETETTHARIVAWYNQLLALDEDAINNVPSEIQYYL